MAVPIRCTGVDYNNITEEFNIFDEYAYMS